MNKIKYLVYDTYNENIKYIQRDIQYDVYKESYSIPICKTQAKKKNIKAQRKILIGLQILFALKVSKSIKTTQTIS